MAIENRDRISLVCLICRGDAVFVVISQGVQLLPALPLMLWQVARQLLAPWLAVVVFENNSHINLALLCGHQGLGNGGS